MGAPTAALNTVVASLEGAVDDDVLARVVDALARGLSAPVVLLERVCGTGAASVTVTAAPCGTPLPSGARVDLDRAPWRGVEPGAAVTCVASERAEDAVCEALRAPALTLAPLRGGPDDAVLGLLVVGRAIEGDDEERAAVALAASRVAARLSSREAHGRAMRARDRLRTAIRIGELLDTRGGNVRPALESVCAEVVRVLGVSAAAVTLVDGHDGVLVRQAHVGLPQRWLDEHPPLARAILDQQPELWKPIGVFDRALLAKLPEAPLYEALDLRTMACTMLRERGEVLGLLSVLTFGSDRQLDLDERLWLEAVGIRVAQTVRASYLMAAIAASEARYRQMVQSCLEGVWVIGADRLLTFVNPQLAAMLGYEPHEMIGRSPLDFIAPAAHEDARRRFQHRRQGIAGRWQVPMRHQDGREVWTIAASSPMFDDEGEFAGVVGFLTDVSERRALEQKVQQAQKLESLGLLAGGLAHDFNNLLVGILGNASLAREELPASSPVAPLLDDIETAGKRAAELTRQMLAYAGKAERRVERLELNQLVRDTLPLVSGVVSRKATLALELSPELLHVSGDVTQLRQILMNLLTNASDALVDGVGRIVVRTGALRLTRSDLDAVSIDHTLDGDAHAFVEVSDDGCGMNPATQARIFDPFFTTKFTGRGLGLAAVLGILRAHGGGISVDSSPGRGSRFRVLLPRVDGDAASTAPPALAATAEGTAPRPIAGGRVLVVDDETAVLQLAVRALERVGYSVDAAKDGAEALARFAERSHEYDAIVLDLTMPGLQGNEVLAGLRARRADVPVVITSGFDELDVRHRFGGDARSWFLAKPWTVGTLVDAVARAIGGRAG